MIVNDHNVNFAFSVGKYTCIVYSVCLISETSERK